MVLPGPPREMKPMFEAVVQERLAPHSGGRGLFRRVLRSPAAPNRTSTPARSRSTALDLAAGPDHHDDSGGARPNRIASHRRRRQPREADAALDAAVAELEDASDGDLQRRRAAARSASSATCCAQALTIAVAESCTGGLLASRLTDVPGSSAYVERGVVCYSNRAKVELLGVPETLIAEHGAVSEPVARAMAEGIRARAHTDVGIGVTGIAGPGGGTPDKPVGTVAIAVVAGDDDACAHVSVHRRPRTGEVPGGPGGAQHGAAMMLENDKR